MDDRGAAVVHGYQTYRIALSPTGGLIGLTIFDLIIVALTWREYQQQRHGHHTDAASHVAGDGVVAPTQTDQ